MASTDEKLRHTHGGAGEVLSLGSRGSAFLVAAIIFFIFIGIAHAGMGRPDASGSRPVEAAASDAATAPSRTPTPTGATDATSPSLPGPPMILVPAGEFQMGVPDTDLEAGPEQRPRHKVILKAFLIDRYETTNGDYLKFVRASSTDHPKTCYPAEAPMKEHSPDARWRDDPEWNAPEKPVIGVDWFDAFAYCAWAGKRLPTEAEWEKAAGGTDGRIYPWGEEPPALTPVGNFADESTKKLNPSWRTIRGYDDGFPHTAPVGSFPKGASPYGVEDMAGNVWEWVYDWFRTSAYGDPVYVDPRGPEEGDSRVARGGSWDSTPNLLKLRVRHTQFPAYRGIAIGFRCARDAS